ncbi:MAG: Lnb N-terminal periplasmic domain-containing protein [Nitrospira sp.]
MPLTEVQSSRTRPGWWYWSFRWLFAAIGFLCRVVLVGWAALALYFSNLPWPWSRSALAILFVAFAIWALWLTRRPRMFPAFAGVFLSVLVWWIFIPASHDRPWRSEVAVLPRAIIDGDRVRFTNVRHFTYRTRDDFDIRYEEREVSISHLQTVDLYVSYWHDGPVGHTFLSFGFDNAPPVAISIETRPEIGEGFDPIASLFKQFELIYLVGDEHDLVGSRAIHRNEEIFLYRIHTTPENARQLFLIYLERINEIYDRPEWYHLLSNSCTINIIRYANRTGPSRGFDIRHFLNGFIDRYVYATGAIQTDLTFDELRRRSHINEMVRKEYDAPDFPERIRAGIPTIHP